MYVCRCRNSKIWLRGWALSRELLPPVNTATGFKVEVGWPQQKQRYVFPCITDEFKELAYSISDTAVFLKVCDAADKIIYMLPERWVIQPQGYMMICTESMPPKNVVLPRNYTLSTVIQPSGWMVQIATGNGDIVVTGRIILVDEWAIYERITTDPAHRRKGLATMIMQTLERIAWLHDRAQGVLIATAAGKMLYETLGWEQYSLYTSIVIPQDNEER